MKPDPAACREGSTSAVKCLTRGGMAPLESQRNVLYRGAAPGWESRPAVPGQGRCEVFVQSRCEPAPWAAARAKAAGLGCGPGEGKVLDLQGACAGVRGSVNSRGSKDPHPGPTPRWPMFDAALVTQTWGVACPHCPGKLCSSRGQQTVP